MVNSAVVMAITIKENILMTFTGTFLKQYSEYNKNHVYMKKLSKPKTSIFVQNNLIFTVVM